MAEISNLEKTKFNVASNHIMENKKILAYMIKDSLSNFNELSIDNIVDRFLTNKELEELGKDNKRFLDEHAEVPGRETLDKSYTMYTISQPGRISLIQVMVKINNQELTDDDIKELYEDTMYTTMERFSSNALYGNSIYDESGNAIQLVCQFLICLYPPESLDNAVLTPEIKFIKEQVYPPTEEEPEEVPIASPFTFFIYGLGQPEEKGILRPDNELLDLIFTTEVEYEKKLEILKEDFDIELDEDEKIDLECITNYRK